MQRLAAAAGLGFAQRPAARSRRLTVSTTRCALHSGAFQRRWWAVHAVQRRWAYRWCGHRPLACDHRCWRRHWHDPRVLLLGCGTARRAATDASMEADTRGGGADAAGGAGGVCTHEATASGEADGRLTSVALRGIARGSGRRGGGLEAARAAQRDPPHRSSGPGVCTP